MRGYQRTDVVVFRAPPAFADYVDDSKVLRAPPLTRRSLGVLSPHALSTAFSPHALSTALSPQAHGTTGGCGTRN